ncbi:hypothetical protein G6F22_018904 [Rhizopus arrhizus]|nr:hypothetical protein G6F22_018904 [Rhizopus arrhizus]
MERVIASLPVVTGPEWAGVNYFCTTRAGGVGVAPHDTLNLGRRAGDDPDTVAENRRRVRAAVPADPLWLRQVHGSEVRHGATGPRAGRHGGGLPAGGHCRCRRAGAGRGACRLARPVGRRAGTYAGGHARQGSRGYRLARLGRPRHRPAGVRGGAGRA